MSVCAKSVDGTGYSITRAVLYVCLIIFPFIILYIEMERFFALEIADRRSEIFDKAGRQLLRFSEYTDDARFFHLLLQKSFAAEATKKDTEAWVAGRSQMLKKLFPETFTFIFWDKSGNLMASASDDTRFSFLSKKLNVLLGTIRRETIAGAHTEDGFSEKFAGDMRLLRQFLGPFATPEVLVKPFLNDASAGCFQLHARGDRVLGWYSACDDFSVLVYISDKIRGRLSGPDFLQKQLKGRMPGIDFILIDEQQQKLVPSQTEPLNSRIFLNFGKFRRLVPSEQLVSEGDYFNYQKLNQRWWVAAVLQRGLFASVSATTGRFMARIFVYFVLVTFILYCYFMVHENPLHSVKSKLIAIFAYIIFIPALVFTVVSFDYLKQKEKQFVTEQAVEAFQYLTSVDNQFRGFLHAKASELNQTFAGLFPRGSESFTVASLASAAASVNAGFKPDTFVFSDASGADLLKAAYANTIKDDFLRKTAARELLTYLNCNATNQYNPDDGIANGFARSFSENHQKLMPFTLANTTYLSYLNALRKPVTGEYAYLMQLFWPEKQMHVEYLNRVVAASSAAKQKQFFFAMPDMGKTLPEPVNLPGLRPFFEKVLQHGPSQQKLAGQDGRTYMVFGQGGTNVNSALMAVVVDSATLNDEIGRFRKNLWIMAGLSLLMTLSLFQILGYYLILPINALAGGVEMVKRRNYSYRIDMPFDNEFGQLGKSIDRSLENLQELEIARTVQESLLPQQSLAFGPFSISARTRIMTTLGGDYFDFVVDAENNLTVLMADVAGHGVQAGLLMAMAKSVLLLNNVARVEPEKLMEGLNRTFCTLRKAEISTMMTGQVVHISREHAVSFFNAGHCPPLIISDGGRTLRLLECHSLPYGFSAKRKFSGMPVDLQPGETMLLYTDGILECVNANREILGMDGFKNAAMKAWNENPEVFLENLFGVFDSWAASQQDDISFVLIRHGKSS